MNDAQRIAADILSAYESGSGTVLGIAWVHRPAITSLLVLAAQQGMDTCKQPLEALAALDAVLDFSVETTASDTFDDTSALNAAMELGRRALEEK